MRLQSLVINGFKSFPKKTTLTFESPVVCVVGPNGSGKSNVVEAIRFVLGEQSMKSMRGKAGSDLIFKGSKSLPAGSRASVSIYLDNKDKVFKLTGDEGENIDLGFDTVSISREVYSDGVNRYSLNDSDVRLKDINNLLSSVNIGSSGHHIISQGEADRILNANSRERKEMVEDALGLKIYQYKIKEAERKLDRAGSNMQEVSMLRRENAPHLKFLEKQVEKIEKAKELAGELLSLYKEYLKKQSVYLETERANLSKEKSKVSAEILMLEKQISEAEEDGAPEEKNMAELSVLEKRVMDIRRLRGELERKIGRVEGMMDAEKERARRLAEKKVVAPEEAQFAFEKVETLVAEALSKESLVDIRPILERIKAVLEDLHRQPGAETNMASQIEALEKSRQEIFGEIEKIAQEEKSISEKTEILRAENREMMEAMRQKEKEKFGLKVRQQELHSALGMILVKEEGLKHQQDDFNEEIREGEPLVGTEIRSYKEFQFEGAIDHALQEETRKKIERIKIKLEDAGLSGGADIMTEYKDATERDVFLSRELEDLEKSMETLRSLIADLKEKIDVEFKEGVKKINNEFQKLFALMFGGGTAILKIIMEGKGRSREEEREEEDFEEEIVFEQGIEISVSLPQKKVKELHALSGGERSLTSIALLFAMSAVNPPPFLVLDETDAALDEANSRKYGDMLQILSKHSQLVVITHNRETMSRAGILYGVTIGSDGASKLLSVKFDEAVAIAK
ncbi:MAG TPA: AAA family ATPase [Candidatus Paceibacterota bacterium]|nr:AAA family ATPase [Candidatus Paceibacterota bacterium]